MAQIRTAVTLAPHQQAALSKLQDGNILWAGVGSGKSRVGIAYYMLTEQNNQDLIIITTAKKRDSIDWETEAARFGVGKAKDATHAGVMTVDSWNNIEKYIGVEGAFFIFDEQRLVGSGAWAKAFLKIAKKNRWIMLSATPGDTWLDYIPVMVANGFYKNRTEFKREHVIYAPFSKYPKVERYVNVQRLVRYRNSILVHMPYPKETVRHPVNVWCEFDEQLMARVSHGRWNVYKDEPIRDIAEMFMVMRRVANSDESRVKEFIKLVSEHPRIIVFYNFNYELDIIRSLTGTLWQEHEIAFAEWNGHKHEAIPTTDKWVYAVQYVAGSEGWNCIETNVEVFWSLPYSYKIWEQAHGRIDRINTEFIDLYYYILRSKATIDHAIWRSLKSKQNFQPSHFDMTGDEFYEMSYQGRKNYD